MPAIHAIHPPHAPTSAHALTSASARTTSIVGNACALPCATHALCASSCAHASEAGMKESNRRQVSKKESIEAHTETASCTSLLWECVRCMRLPVEACMEACMHHRAHHVPSSQHPPTDHSKPPPHKNRCAAASKTRVGRRLTSSAPNRARVALPSALACSCARHPQIQQ